MQSTTLAFRTAIVNALNNIVFDTKRIGVFEEYVQETSTNKKALLANCEAYIILLNQTSNDNSARCVRNDEVSIQIQITTVFPAGKGGSKTSEQISELVINQLFTSDGLFKKIAMPSPFGLWKMELPVSGRQLNFNENESRIWITQLVVLGYLNQSATV